MLIIALVLAVVGLAALVAAVVTSNELIAWVCIGASVIGVLLLVVDAVRERSAGRDADETDGDESDGGESDGGESDGGEEAASSTVTAEDYPDESEEASADDEKPVATSEKPVATSEKSDADDVDTTDAAKPD